MRGRALPPTGAPGRPRCRQFALTVPGALMQVNRDGRE